MPNGLCQSRLAICSTGELHAKRAIALQQTVRRTGFISDRGATNLQITVQQGIVVNTFRINMTKDNADDVEPILYTVRRFECIFSKGLL